MNSPSNLPFPLSFHLPTALLIMVIEECFCVLVLLGRFAVVRRLLWPIVTDGAACSVGRSVGLSRS